MEKRKAARNEKILCLAAESGHIVEINNSEKIVVTCQKCGHKRNMTKGGFLKYNQKCPNCNKIEDFKEKTEYYRKACAAEGYELKDNYKGCFILMEMLCDEKHNCSIRPADWDFNHRCSTCARNKQKTWKEIEESLNEEGYTIKEHPKIYKNSETDFIAECPEGHKYKACWNIWSKGRRCPACFGTFPITKEQIAEALAKKECVPIFENNKQYTSKTMFERVCNKDRHRTWTCWNWVQQGCDSCPDCHKNKSPQEEEILKFIISLGITNVILNTTDIVQFVDENNRLHKQEIDLFLPEFNLAIEHSGLFHHSDTFKDKYYHRKKYEECLKRGIRLIQVFGDEWEHQRPICESRIASILGKAPNKVGARECQLVELTKTQARHFFNENHLQEAGSPFKAFGLEYNNKVVFTMSLKAHLEDLDTLDIDRLATTLNYTVSGGAQKVFNAIVKWAKENKYNKIVSYCDLRWGTGNVYQKLGFKYVNESKWSQHFIVNGHRKRRHAAWFTNDKERAEAKELGMTQDTYACQVKGYRVIWDCGHQRWDYEIK